MNNKFSLNLKKIRKDNNLSQEELADMLCVSRQAISKWESGSAYPEMEKIIALCEKFNLNIDDLLHKDIREVKGEEESKKNLNNLLGRRPLLLRKCGIAAGQDLPVRVLFLESDNLQNKKGHNCLPLLT